MELICKQLGGSHSYGLNTASSDIDHRGIFVNESVSDIIGLGRHDHQQNQGNGVDEVYTEFRNALKLLRGANTQMVELLFNKEWVSLTPQWEHVQSLRSELLCSEKLFSCLRGYMEGELKLANGERTGKLGGKRKEAIEKYGFSPKNFVQLLRLSWCGITYFKTGFFPVNVKEYSPKFSDMLLTIKTKPEFYTKGELNSLAESADKDLVESFDNRKVTTKFNDKLANELCLEVYGPKITKAHNKL